MAYGSGSSRPCGGGTSHHLQVGQTGPSPYIGERVARIRVEDLEKLVMQARPLYANGHADKAARAAILQKTKGAWADNPLIDQALAELNRGWHEWAEKSF